MNELQRQQYLSALNIDSYMPRLRLPFAPLSIICELPNIAPVIFTQTVNEFGGSTVSPCAQPQKEPETLHSSSNISSVKNIMDGVFEQKKNEVISVPSITAKDILAQLTTKTVTLEPFSLSIWRPVVGVMIIDSRNSKLALPTELLLHNILRETFFNQTGRQQEEVLHWPMIENSFTKRTLQDARVELQTWFSVQQEIRPSNHIWLMGTSAATYLVPETVDLKQSMFTAVQLESANMSALILPSLNELLKQPLLKKKLFSAIRRYHADRS